MMCRTQINPRMKPMLALIAAFAIAPFASGQTLARPGWVGSGMTAQSWFKHAVLYRIDTRTFAHSAGDPQEGPGKLKGTTERLDYIRNLGVDAVLLEDLAPAAGQGPIDPALGTVDDFDELSLQASKRNLRILLTMPHPDAAVARYWLTRGVAGFYIPGSLSSPAVPAIRKLLPSFVGQRILVTDADLTATAAAKAPANELQLDPALLKLPTPPATGAAAQLRSALEQSQTLLHAGAPAIATDAHGLAPSVSRFAPSQSQLEAAKTLAALLLLNRSAPVIYAGQELAAAATGSAAMIPWGKPSVAESEPAEEAAAPRPAPPPAAPSTPFVASERYVPYVPPAKPIKAAKAAPPDPATAAGQELNPASVLNFYRQLIQLHHGKTSVRDGDEILLNYDNTNALVMVRRPANPSLTNPPLIVLCNLSATPLRLSIKADLTNLHLRGSFLRSVLNPESQAVSMNLDPVTLPAYGVYVGELRY